MVSYDELGARIIISFGDGSVFITESTLWGLIVAAILAVLGIWLGSGLEKIPKGKQVIAEFIVGWLYKFTDANLGKENRGYAPYIGTIFGFILLGSSLGIFGIRPITASLNVTAALAVLTFLLIQSSAIRTHGVKGRIKEMCEPYPFMFPLEVIEACTLPVSLALRLFGNILGGLIVVELWMHLMEYLSSLVCNVPFLRAVTVLPINAFFDMFEPVIQTYIFTLLTMINLYTAIKVTESHGQLAQGNRK
ncbi:MAG: FoF1 ATP synthase subunit a [Clostridia bacterium]|nr:FoF1 ATP synthase subunit a [Clostridia bacterium]